ncbi:MAG: hypothetical protein IJX05_06245, partial [Clostridia bacterium]|nr:hypothetical protein [Clostridia bacterium]
MEIFFPANNVMLLLYILQLMLAEALFVFPLARRNNFVARIIGGGVAFALCAYFIPILIYQITPGFLTMSVFIISLFYIWFCFNHSFWDVLFCGIGAVTTQNLADNV